MTTRLCHSMLPVLLCVGLSIAGCKDDPDQLLGSHDSGISDSGPLDAAVPTSDAGKANAPDCYANPTRHIEIINACTSAERVDKRSVLPLLLLDGGLPPLP